jgi:hypothetical protein
MNLASARFAASSKVGNDPSGMVLFRRNDGEREERERLRKAASTPPEEQGDSGRKTFWWMPLAPY